MPSALGRPPLRCPPALVSTLGTIGDQKIAESAGVTLPTVRRWRQERGIRPWRRRIAVAPLAAHPARTPAPPVAARPVLPVAAEIAAMPRPKPSPEVLAPMAADRRWSDDERAELARRVEAGETNATIAAAFGRSLKSVANARLYKPKAAEPTGDAMKLINARIPLALYNAIDARAEAKGVIVSATIRELLEAGAAALGMTS